MINLFKYKKRLLFIIAPPFFYITFVAGGFITYFLGRCEGALGSGVECEAGKFAEVYAGMTELSRLLRFVPCFTSVYKKTEKILEA